MSTEIARVRTALVMARGLGTRMRAAAEETQLDAAQSRMAERGMKGMIDVGRPFLDHVVSAAADAGVTRVVLVIGPEHDEIRNYYGTVPADRVTFEFAVQAEPLGTGDAVACARAVIGDEPFFVLNSDNYYPASALEQLQGVDGMGLVGFDAAALTAKGNIPAERVRSFALVEVTADGQLASIVEKPDAETFERLGADAPVSMNCYRFTPEIFDHLAELTPSARGEYELTDAVRAALSSGDRIAVVRSDEPVLDLSTRHDVAGVQAILKDREVHL
ncbi:nucleotidyltransferase family protein [Tessaracoccus lacteus]|uniref:Nucleotidyltransferase family protein n=1 Tax=Tessaracoccus lacteus TaxID=3041766 RepID=A0ABY8PYE9_9ACTN|nr:nucleotidyltransferase family protein [Tessaracoccus sp. T21]WGT47311.1 nucleotidyltransferase family protein [Tessaracoccus sp. T21]